MVRTPTVGSRISVTIEGVVTDYDENGPSLALDGGDFCLSWQYQGRLPGITVLDPDWKLGDVAWYTRPDGGGRKTVIYSQRTNYDKPSWVDARGVQIFVPFAAADRIEIIARSE